MNFQTGLSIWNSSDLLGIVMRKLAYPPKKESSQDEGLPGDKRAKRRRSSNGYARNGTSRFYQS
jgi:hypothetical protein